MVTIRNLLRLTTILTVFNLYTPQKRIPGLYRGECAIINDNLYYLGGVVEQFKKDITTNENVLSTEVFKLTLNGATIDEFGEAPWESIVPEYNPKGKLVSVVAEGNGSPNIIMFGGLDVKPKDIFNVFDTSTNRWKLDKEASNNWPATKFADNPNKTYSIARAQLFKSNDGEYIQFGGLMKDGSGNGIPETTSINIFNNNNKTWSQTQNVWLNVFDYVGCVYKGNVYIISGRTHNVLNYIQPDLIMQYNLATMQWSNKTVTGEIPSVRSGAKGVLVDNLFYMVGGSTSTKLNGSKLEVNILNLNEFKWSHYSIKNIPAISEGCLAYYNKHLIYSFGSVKDSNEHSSKTYFINIKNFNSVNSLLGSNSINLAAILGGSIGGIIFILLLVIAIYYRKKKRAKTTESTMDCKNIVFSPPIFLKELVWSDEIVNSQDLIFNLETSTIAPDIDTDLDISSLTAVTKNV